MEDAGRQKTGPGGLAMPGTRFTIRGFVDIQTKFR
jgi:hypothetical protein